MCSFAVLSLTQAQALEIADNMSTYDIDNNYISPYMDYISYASSNIYISNGKATISCSVYGYQGITTCVKIDAKLQQYRMENGLALILSQMKETHIELALMKHQA